MEVKIVGSIQFKNHTLPVYGDLDEPLFKATDVADLLEYGSNNVWNLTSICEEDEKVVLPTVVAGQRRKVTFITETGLYNVLAQSRKTLARAWRRVIHEELIALRRVRGKNISEQFEDWGSSGRHDLFRRGDRYAHALCHRSRRRRGAGPL